MKMTKTLTNVDMAELLRAIAAAYEIKDKNKNKFKIIAYERAADAIEHLSSEAKDLWDDNKLEEVAGLGPSIISHMSDIFSKGTSQHFENVLSGIPEAVYELLPIEGIGAKTAYILSQKLHLKPGNAVGQLLKKAKQGEIAKLEGFGEDSQKAIIVAISEIQGRVKRHLLNYALNLAEEVITWLKKDQNTVRADVLGSLRRKASTVGDLDLAASSSNPIKTIEHFAEYPKATRVLEKGTATSSIILPGDIQVDLMVEKPDAYGSVLQHFTGSKHHNIHLREYSLKKGFSLSEHGIKQLRLKNGSLKKFSNERDFYAFLGMEWIPPELREDTGEIEAALQHAQGKPGGLPKLVETSDIRADLQVHSNFDIETSHDLGQSGYDEIIDKAEGLGYEYIAFTEHNPSVTGHSQGAILDLMKRKKESVSRLNEKLKENNRKIKHVFNSLEIDILPSGKLPISDEAMELLDFALVSIHSSFKQPRKVITQRVINALEHKKVKIFAHPTGRKLNEREGADLDWEKIFDFCLRNKKWLEINADPMRLDLPDYLVKDAVKKGVVLTMGTDSHHIDHMTNMEYAVYVARRGWATKSDIANTRTLEEFLGML